MKKKRTSLPLERSLYLEVRKEEFIEMAEETMDEEIFMARKNLEKK